MVLLTTCWIGEAVNFDVYDADGINFVANADLAIVPWMLEWLVGWIWLARFI